MKSGNLLCKVPNPAVMILVFQGESKDEDGQNTHTPSLRRSVFYL